MEKHNYQRDTDAFIQTLQGRRPRLLLHSCCGPCSSYVLEYLTQYFDLTVLYYNPNIQPAAEYEKRLETQRQVLAHYGVSLLEHPYDGEAYERAVKDLTAEPEGGARCTVCFALRLEETARIAAAQGFDCFTTTLSVSPHKDAQRLNTLGAQFAEIYGVTWLPADFKKRGGYQRSIELSRSWELYRQNYCGCLYSKPAQPEP